MTRGGQAGRPRPRGVRGRYDAAYCPLLRRTTIAALGLLVLEHERLVHTNADARTLFVDFWRNCSELGESALSGGSEPWPAQNPRRRAGRGTHIIGPEISSPWREPRDSVYRRASQWAGDNILSWRPDRGKKVFAHPNSDGLGDRFSKTSSKTHPGTRCVIPDETAPFCGPGTPNLAPFSLSVRHRLSRPRATLVEKNRTEARPSPGTARRCTGAFRAERVPLHQQDSEIGRVGAQFARSRAWSGRGGLHSPDFHSGGPRIFSSTLCTTVWENTRRGAKNPPALHFARVFSGERNTRSCGLRKFLPPPGDKDRVQREHFIGSIFLGLKMLSWALNVAGGRSQAVGAPSSALDRVHFESADSLALRA